MEFLISLAILALVAYVVTRPFVRGRADREGEAHADGVGGGDATDRATALADLEERKRSRYREIRDLELDRAAGKIDDDDFARLDAELRAEAIKILKQIDRLSAEGGWGGKRPEQGRGAPGPGPGYHGRGAPRSGRRG